MPDQTICYIDDCETNLSLIKKAFSRQHNVDLIDSPAAVVDRLVASKPDLILLDVNMPEIDGYEICRSIRRKNELERIPIVFLTCRSSLQDRLTGFEAGGDAYVTKPFDLAELTHIVRAQLTRYQHMRKVESDVESANNMAWTMLQNNNEIGQVVQYARALSRIGDESDLLEKTFSTLNSFGLCSTLLIRLLSGEIVARSDKKPVSVLENELLSLSKQGERILHVGNKYIFNGSNCVMLINNMPVADKELTGRLRDHLAIMLESCDACIELINLRKQSLLTQQNVVKQTQSTVRREFDDVLNSFTSLSQHTEQSFDKLTAAIEQSFMFLGLTEDQEMQLLTYIEEARHDIDLCKGYRLTLQDALNRVADSINQLTNESQER